MAVLPRPSGPRALLADLRRFFGAGNRHRLAFAAVAVGMTSLIITGFIVESRSGILPGRQVVYATDWSSDRSDTEIVAQQKIDQRKRAIAEAEKRAQYRRLARQLDIE